MRKKTKMLWIDWQCRESHNEKKKVWKVLKARQVQTEELVL